MLLEKFRSISHLSPYTLTATYACSALNILCISFSTNYKKLQVTLQHLTGNRVGAEANSNKMKTEEQALLLGSSLHLGMCMPLPWKTGVGSSVPGPSVSANPGRKKYISRLLLLPLSAIQLLLQLHLQDISFSSEIIGLACSMLNGVNNNANLVLQFRSTANKIPKPYEIYIWDWSKDPQFKQLNLKDMLFSSETKWKSILISGETTFFKALRTYT